MVPGGVPAWYPRGTRVVPGVKSVVPWVPGYKLTLLIAVYSTLASGGKLPFYNIKSREPQYRAGIHGKDDTF